MNFAKLLGLKEEISDIDVISMLVKQKDVQVGDVVIRQPTIDQSGVSGDFGEYTPR